ncbi:uncharacterized protein LOC119388896 [Rhipicephalus sanguineus]|uniref:uncharacterized protein LOC119388896 n=1 Tax=Rhipicephalus sanguineus TaxID=34632 RepID=UPI0018945C18|nr:uncharacterized protein LOC119388896 [Rhipicephalus sanguineus]
MESKVGGPSSEESRKRKCSSSPAAQTLKRLNPDGTLNRRWLEQELVLLQVPCDGNETDVRNPPVESDDLDAPSTSRGRGALWIEPPAPPEPPKRPVGVASPFISASVLVDRFTPAVTGLAVGSSPELRRSADDCPPSSSTQDATSSAQVEEQPR